MAEDRTTISLSEEGDQIVRDLVEAGWFVTEVAAFQAAVALALSRGLSIDRGALRNSSTKWNVGTLDPRVRDLVLQFSSETQDRPFEAANLLAEAGLRELGRALENDARIVEALGVGELESASVAPDGEEADERQEATDEGQESG